MSIGDEHSWRLTSRSTGAQPGRLAGQRAPERTGGAVEPGDLLARRKLARRALWIAPALIVGLTLSRTAAASTIEECQDPEDPLCG